VQGLTLHSFIGGGLLFGAILSGLSVVFLLFFVRGVAEKFFLAVSLSL
jgi:hypothetical protein